MYGTTIYTDNYSFSKLYNPEGYITGAVIPDVNNYLNGIQYNYFRKDHVGNIHEVWQAAYTKNSGTVAASTLQRTSYYPSGLPWYETTSTLGSSIQPRKYGGKEYIEMGGLDEYDSQARNYYATLPSTPTPDPLCEKYYSTSPYVWCSGNPVRFVDPDGRDPGDFFNSREAASKDFCMIYNDNSIRSGQEFGSRLYTIKDVNGSIGYTYTSPNMGETGYTVPIPNTPIGSINAGAVHTHGNYSYGKWDDNSFSGSKDYYGNVNSDQENKVETNIKTDIGISNKEGQPIFVSTPDGSFQKYDPMSGKIEILDKKMPSDSNDPTRKNKNDANIEHKPIVIPKFPETFNPSAPVIKF